MNLLLADDSTAMTIGIVGAIFGGLAGLVTASVGVLTLYFKYRSQLNELTAKREAEKNTAEADAFGRAEQAYKEYIQALKEERDRNREVVNEYRQALTLSQEAERDCEDETNGLREYLHAQRDALINGKQPPPVPTTRPRRKKQVAEFQARQAHQAAIEAAKVTQETEIQQPPSPGSTS